MAKKSLFSQLKKITKNEYAFTLGEENPYEVKQWVDTGCYTLNAALSDGDIFKGLPVGKRIVLAGKSGVAKSLFTIYLIKRYMMQIKNAKIVCFESEGSSTVSMAKKVGIADEDMIIIPVTTIEECRTQLLRVVDAQIEHNKGLPEDERENFIYVIDSLGMLATEKEVADISEGNNAKDMTRSGLIRAFGRATTLKFSISQSPLIVVNHTHTDIMSYGAPEKVSGGEGIIYMGDVILILAKSKDVEKQGGKKMQIGVIIKAKITKSRFARENLVIPIHLAFKTGMQKYGGLMDFIEAYEVIETKNGGPNGKIYVMPDGEEVFKKDFDKNKKKYLAEDTVLMQTLRTKMMEAFALHSTDDSEDGETEEDYSDATEATTD